MYAGLVLYFPDTLIAMSDMGGEVVHFLRHQEWIAPKVRAGMQFFLNDSQMVYLFLVIVVRALLSLLGMGVNAIRG